MDYSQADWIKMKANLIFVGIIFLNGIVYGQIPPAGISGTLPVEEITESNGTLPIVPRRSSQTETIKKAEYDLRHGEEGGRVGAAKLLGKYRNSMTTSILVGALDDQSAFVRRASIVSLSEHFLNGFPLLDKSLFEKIFSKLGDPDVEVRREVSTLIPRLVSTLMRGGVARVVINGRSVYRSVPASLRPDLLTLTQKAFLDEDAIVRQNILKYHSYLRVPLPPLTLEKLLKDEDRGVLLTALDRISYNASQIVIIREIERLSTHEDKGIRLKVVDVARDSNRYHPRYRAVLRSMMEDKDPEVMSMAAVELARFNEKIPPEVIERIKGYLLAAKGMSSQVTTILYAVSAMGEDGVGVYRSLTEHGSAKMRTVAWQRFLSLSNGWSSSKNWLPAMSDRDRGVREAVVNSLRGRLGQIDLRTMQTLVESPNSDVRSFAGTLLSNADDEAFDEFGFELLIDDDLGVRIATIKSMGIRKQPGWLKIMERSLLDQEYSIQQSAMEALLTDLSRGTSILRNYTAKNPGERISPMIQIELQRRGVFR